MGDDLTLPERNCARTPMQWSTEPHGGFTKSDKPVLPVISGGPYGFEHVNAADPAARSTNSLLNWTERIIRMRKEVPEIGWGDFADPAPARPGGPRAALRLAQQFRRHSCTISTPSRARSRLMLASKARAARLLVNLLSDDHSEAQPNGKHKLVIEGYGYRWYRAGGLDYLLRRTEA